MSKKQCQYILIFFFFATLMYFMIYLSSGFAQEKHIKPGEYITEGGWGHLSINQQKDGTLTFNIFALGANFHQCELDGTIKNGKSILENGCVVHFSLIDENIDVSSNAEGTGGGCRYYCGMRASFEGKYLKVKKCCEGEEIQKTREEFKRLYDKKDFAAARLKLESLLRDCKKTLSWIGEYWILNDLAITQYKLHDCKGCLQTLEPLKSDALKTNNEALENYPPGEAAIYEEILNATRTNLKLCNKCIKK